MLTKEDLFDEEKVFAKIKNYLPAQAPLKDFVQYNILYSFQNLQFNEALLLASKVFGYKVFYPLSKYRELYHTKAISSEILHLKIAESKGKEKEKEWLNKLLHGTYNEEIKPRIGTIRNLWKKQYKFDLDSMVQPTLFRILAGYLDQGVSIWSFPTGHKGLYAAIKDIERNSFLSIFKSTRTKALLFSNSTNCTDLLKILVGDSTLYEQYLFDQQFSHQGWSGLVSMVENFPNTLIDTRKISVKDIIYLELLLEIDALDQQFGTDWKPLNSFIKDKPDDLFKPVESTELHEVYSIWHSAFEWTYYDQVLSGLKAQKIDTEIKISRRFQGLFCIDDRECAFRRHLERAEPYCETYGTPGFFGVEFYFKPDHGKAYAKLCPAPVTPKHLIKEQGTIKRKRNDPHFNKHTHTLLGGFLMSNTIGFWSALKLFLNIFRPSMSQAVATSLRHMDKSSNLTIENTNIDHKENHLQIGYTLDEMIERADKLLKSIGLVNNFAPIVYIMGHGSSTVNNPHFAAYDCGACSSKPGSVNARVMAHILNNKRVRAGLKIKGIDIPDETDFVGGLHDTTLDEVTFFDEFLLSFDKTRMHNENVIAFEKACSTNAKERARRFENIELRKNAKEVHNKVKLRAFSLFQPRPEWDHANNAMCIVGRRIMTKNLFFDRRTFLNSYDYKLDPTGEYLFDILRAVAPVCGGINLEYFFSKLDNQRFGSGSKLPHNVVGLFGVANGADGDLRPGLASQMIEIHDAVRLLLIVEQFPDLLLSTIKKSEAVEQWFLNNWINLIAINPETRQEYYYINGIFTEYNPISQHQSYAKDMEKVIESNKGNIPVHIYSES